MDILFSLFNVNFIEYLPWVPEIPETALENGLWHPGYRVSDEVFLFLNRILNAQTIFRVSTIFLKNKGHTLKSKVNPFP